MKIRNFGITALAGAALLAGVAGAHATTVAKLSFDELVADSSLIFDGQVTATRSERTENGIMTYATVSVSDAVVGSAGSTLTVITPGGTAQIGRFKIGETYPGAPNLLVGERAIFFVENSAEEGAFQVTGFSQGVMEVVTTSEGEAVVARGNGGQPTSVAEMKQRIKASKAKGRGPAIAD